MKNITFLHEVNPKKFAYEKIYIELIAVRKKEQEREEKSVNFLNKTIRKKFIKIYFKKF